MEAMQAAHAEALEATRAEALEAARVQEDKHNQLIESLVAAGVIPRPSTSW